MSNKSSARLRPPMSGMTAVALLLLVACLSAHVATAFTACSSIRSSSSRGSAHPSAPSLRPRGARVELGVSSSVPAEDVTASAEQIKRLQTLADLANEAIEEHGSEVLKTFNARVGVILPSGDDEAQGKFLRLGLVATGSASKGDLVASLPFNEGDGSGLALEPNFAAKIVYDKVLPEGYDGWTGDVGFLAMLLLNEMARQDADSPKGVDLPRRKEGVQALMSAWIASLPSFEEMTEMHPLLWNEDEQEIMQLSSTKKIYRLLDDIEDDSSWLDENVWSADREKFPETVKIRVGDADEERQCFTVDGFRYAVAVVRSRSFFVDGALRLLPYVDYANHDDYDSNELVGGGIGMLWGSSKGVLLKSGKALRVGDEVRISYGPKGPADYILDHGFVPPMCQLSTQGGAITAELSFEVDESDRFRDDKLDILEFETYDLAPMEPAQVFDVVGGPGSTGEPDPAMIQFLRLVKLAGKDAFLLESIFRKEIWGFMSEPVSEDNEKASVTAVQEACEAALSDMNELESEDSSASPSLNEQLCSMVRGSEREALERTLAYIKQEAEALDLKEYYQERRLKTLGLDSEWTPEDEFGSTTRVPGAADYDW
mmetsp:Transcript_10638/g.24296  ORF Transcript_10638/g.24296 Transcript_10638/m.24296 type:complete len:600 (+) Transcript_10638:57-1856(+)